MGNGTPAALALAPFDFGEETPPQSVAPPGEGLLESGDLDDIDACPDDHGRSKVAHGPISHGPQILTARRLRFARLRPVPAGVSSRRESWRE